MHYLWVDLISVEIANVGNVEIVIGCFVFPCLSQRQAYHAVARGSTKKVISRKHFVEFLHL